MVHQTIIQKNAYYDSVALMSLSSKILALDGVKEAVITMATEMNKGLLENVGLATEASREAENNDLIIAIQAEDEASFDEALKQVHELLNTKKGKKKGQEAKPKTLLGALKQLPDANLALISVPGQYAAREARLALEQGLHVMMFSDHVSLEEEKSLKELAREKGLLMMGPDCGTAAINGTGLCFANQVRKGTIGIVAASGTGLQEVMVQIHRLGGGISQAIGTGGRDLKEEIGGIMMLEGLKALDRDPDTKVIVLVSKPPSPGVEDRILNQVKVLSKPAVVCFLDGDSQKVEAARAQFGVNLFDTAQKAVTTAGIRIQAAKAVDRENRIRALAEEAKKGLGREQQFIRGLYGGGTLCAEALSLLRKELKEIKSNIGKGKERLEDLNRYDGHVLLDLGEDEFTLGKPHPMIEPSLRLERIRKEAADPTVAVILLDFVLGYGAHEAPVEITLEAIRKAKEQARQENRSLILIVYLCGTELDKQQYERQRALLKDEGVLLAESNEEAARLALAMLR